MFFALFFGVEQQKRKTRVLLIFSRFMVKEGWLQPKTNTVLNFGTLVPPLKSTKVPKLQTPCPDHRHSGGIGLCSFGTLKLWFPRSWGLQFWYFGTLVPQVMGSAVLVLCYSGSRDKFKSRWQVGFGEG